MRTEGLKRTVQTNKFQMLEKKLQIVSRIATRFNGEGKKFNLGDLSPPKVGRRSIHQTSKYIIAAPLATWTNKAGGAVNIPVALARATWENCEMNRPSVNKPLSAGPDAAQTTQTLFALRRPDERKREARRVNINRMRAKKRDEGRGGKDEGTRGT